MTDGWDTGTKETVRKIPLLSVSPVSYNFANCIDHDSARRSHDAAMRLQINAGPRQKELWEKRLKEVQPQLNHQSGCMVPVLGEAA